MITIIPNELTEAIEVFLNEVEEGIGDKFKDEAREKNKQTLIMFYDRYGKLPDKGDLIKSLKLHMDNHEKKKPYACELQSVKEGEDGKTN